MKRNNVSTFIKSKKEGTKLALLTVYDYTTAKQADLCGIDGILIGDSLGMVCLGYKDTLPVTIEDMLHHTKAVARGVGNALIIADMPFMSYHASVYEAVHSAGRLIQEGRAESVKLEGGSRVLRQVRAIVRAQIPVMGHLGLTPQSVNVFGGFKVQGKNRDTADQLVEDAKRLEDAGVFSIVLECIPEEVAARITEAVAVSTIGIGAGARCDGQILVYHDMLGIYSDVRPKHVKVFADAGAVMRGGIKDYIKEVKGSAFPAKEHTFY